MMLFTTVLQQHHIYKMRGCQQMFGIGSCFGAFGGYGRSLGGYGGTGWFGGGIFMMIFIILIIAAAVYFITKSSKRSPYVQSGSNALEILKLRYAKGEMSDSEYAARREALMK
jgi:putative membrane protein